jgi:hypothetical protein
MGEVQIKVRRARADDARNAEAGSFEAGSLGQRSAAGEC